MKKKRQKIKEKIIVISFLVIVFLVPLIFLESIYSIELTKIGVLYGGLFIILCLWVYKFFKEKEFPRVTSPIFNPLVIFFLISILATIFSQYPYVSLIGGYNRLQGLLTITAYIFLFYISSILARKRNVLGLILNIILLANFFAGIYAIVQRLHLDPYQWLGGEYSRIHSTFGNPVFYAAWLSMVLPLNLVLYLKEENKKKGFIYTLSFIFTYILLLFTNTRATFVGYFGASFLFFLFVLRKKLIFLFYGITGFVFAIFSFLIIFFLNPLGIPALFIGGLFIGLFFFGLFFLLRKLLPIGIICILLSIIFNLNPQLSIAGRFFTTIERKKPQVVKEEKIAAIEEARGGIAESFQSSAGFRIMVWKICFKIIKDYPILGIGPETLGYVFPKYRDLSYIRRFSEYSLTDRVHNEIFDTTLNYGIPGLAVYIWLFFIVFSVGIRAIYKSGVKSQESGVRSNRLLIIGILCLQAAYLIQNEFSFQATTITSLSWIMIGILAGITSPEKIIIIESKAKRYLIGIPLILTSIIFVVLLIPYFIADIEFSKGRFYEEEKMDKLAIDHYKKAISYYPFEESYYYPLAKILLTRGKKEEIKEAIKIFVQGLTYTPQSSFLWHSLGGGCYIMGKEDEAIISYSEALKIDPYYAPSHYCMGLIYKKNKTLEKAKKSLEYAVNISHNNPQYLETLGNLYMEMGEENEGKRVFKRIKSLSLK